jgi:hypothetical protein
MKSILSILVLVMAQSAMADGGCKLLANYVGTYKQVSKSCDDQFHFQGPTLTVTPYNESTYSGYWIASNSTAFGPTDGANDADKCTVRGNDVLVEISGNDTTGTVLPRKGRISYLFSSSSVTFTADGCTATYSK